MFTREILLVAVALLFLAACAQAGSTPTPSPAPSSSKALAPPILTELQAIETAGQKAALSRIELTGVSNIRNQQARLMTMGEYWALGHYDYGFFGSAEWYRKSDLPVWVVLMEGIPESPLPTSSSFAPSRYNYYVVVLNAHTGYEIGFSPLSAPKQLLAEAQGLDPALYARYPLEAALEYTNDITDFPVSEPSSLPGGFSLAKVTLELAHPLQDVLPYPQERRQTVLQHYSDGQGNTIQLAQFSGGLPDLIEDSDRTTVQKTKAWASHKTGESTWLAWTWVFPEAGAYVTYILYSVDRSNSLDTLHEIAASMPAGRPPPPTPEPVSVPTAAWKPLPLPTSIPTPLGTPTLTPAPRPTVDQAKEEGPPKGPGVVIGQPYSFRIGGHCGVRDTRFDGRWWLPDPVPAYGSNNPPTAEDGVGTMTLVAEDRAVFAARSGRTVEFLPRPPNVESRPCF